MPHPVQVHIIGATGRSGTALCRSLQTGFVPVVRDAAKWSATGIDAPPRIADLTDPTVTACRAGRCHAHRLLRARPPRAAR